MEREKKEKYISEIINCAYRENVMHMWLRLALRGVSVLDFFRANNLFRVVVYGYGKIGRMLCEEIEGSGDIVLVAVIDRNYKKLNGKTAVSSPEDPIPEHDIVISTVSDINYVRDKLKGESENIAGFDELLKGYGL